MFETTSGSYSNISSISVKTRGQETLANVTNYIMYADTENQFLTKLEPAVTMLNALSSSDQLSFFGSEDYDTVSTRTRLLAWAASQGQKVRLEDGRVDVSSMSRLYQVSSINESSSVAPWFVLLSLLGVATLNATYYCFRRRLDN